MNLPDPEKTPLLYALSQYSDRFGFHMPGHASGRAFPDWLKENIPAYDVTELTGLDDLNDPSGPLLFSMQKAASFYGAASTCFVVSGTTVSIAAALSALMGKKRSLALPRAVHKSVIHAAALLGLSLTTLQSSVNPGRGILPQVAEGQKFPKDANLLFLTSPDYYGRCFDFSSLIRNAHEHGAAVLVDAAHGAHLKALDQGDRFDALAQGADLVAMSAHKTLPALTPCSLLHVSSGALRTGRIQPEAVARMLPVFQTSSPPLLQAATLEYAIDWLVERGQEEMAFARERIERLICTLPDDITALRDGSSDPLRLVLDVSETGRDGRDVAFYLQERGIDIEMAEPCLLILIVSPFLPDEAFVALSAVLRTFPRAPVTDDLRLLAARVSACLTGAAPAALPLREALFGGHRTEQVLLRSASGRISAGCLAPTPPCVPLVWPGERLLPETVDLLTLLGRSEEMKVTVLA